MGHAPEVFAEHMDYLHDAGLPGAHGHRVRGAAQPSRVRGVGQDRRHHLRRRVRGLHRARAARCSPATRSAPRCTSSPAASGRRAAGSRASARADRPMMAWSDLEALAPGRDRGRRPHPQPPAARHHQPVDRLGRDPAQPGRARGPAGPAGRQLRLPLRVPRAPGPGAGRAGRVPLGLRGEGRPERPGRRPAGDRPGDRPRGHHRGGTLADLLEGRGRPVAWRGERTSTRAFRVARRSVARARGLRAGYARTPMGGRSNAEGEPTAEAYARPMTSTEAAPMVPRTARRRKAPPRGDPAGPAPPPNSSRSQWPSWSSSSAIGFLVTREEATTAAARRRARCCSTRASTGPA